MTKAFRLTWIFGVALVAAAVATTMTGTAIRGEDPPYRLVPGWGALAAPLTWGETPAITLDAGGRVFAFTRADTPIIELDTSGKVLKAWGEKLFVWPHGMRVDRNGFLWITDGRARNGIGQQVFKYTRDGKLLMTLGTKGVAGDGPDTFNGVTDVAVAAERRHLRRRRSRQRADREVLEGRHVHQDVGKEGHGAW